MAQWQALLRLDAALQARVSQLYEGKFPREIRHCLCVLIESLDWDSAAGKENEAFTCFHALLRDLQERFTRSVQENSLLQGPDYNGMKEYLLKYKPLNLALILSECLKEEKKILASVSEAQTCFSPDTDQKWKDLDNKVNKLKTLIMVKEVELREWKHRQQLACIGSPADTSLDHLQEGFTSLAEVLLRVLKQLQELKEQNDKHDSTDASSQPGPMAVIENQTRSLLTQLLENALVVEIQPVMSSLPKRPLILKTGVRFSAKVRFLANLPELQKCLHKVKPVFDKDVEEVKTVKWFRHFYFCRDECKMLDVDTAKACLVAEFGDMTLQEIKGKAKRSIESRLVVTEELHIIKFVTQFHYAGLKLNIEASTLPVVVISATTQVTSAWASIMWYNILPTSETRNLQHFVDPPPLTWEQLSQVLSWQFLCTGKRELNENQLSMLRDKFVDDPDGLVHWSNFSRNEHAWAWIDGILDLIKKPLVKLWQDGFIMGFISRERTAELLKEKQTGTFLLRFSESKKNAISFSWVDHSNGVPFVHSIEPYTMDELKKTSLPDYINTYSLRVRKSTLTNPLIYLYPDIHKDIAFGQYYTTTAEKKLSKDGYVGREKVDLSDHPTPPPSPPLYMDIDMDNPDNCEWMQDYFHPNNWDIL
ncbi:hypothetical protein PBY51_022886 [Eleginops maclovinus]|uniref:Signal transducer and activator of transcription n=1 Tax=Eleginops maclovinus TaxID=56733 RepID=A0AAN8AIR7_ELEMC|nr:hypothetical protein PBY51_022886 [Eleginops maclovinus]